LDHLSTKTPPIFQSRHWRRRRRFGGSAPSPGKGSVGELFFSFGLVRGNN
jgi:hypothetical protein